MASTTKTMGRSRVLGGSQAPAALLTSRVDSTAGPPDPSDVFTEEDRALELATRPQRGVPLTSEERKVRRRLQYKLHQRRHRAKQRATTTQLQDEVAQLRDEVDALKHRCHELRRGHRLAPTVFDARGTATGAPVRVSMEFLRLFEHGFVDSFVQEPFLRAMMSPNVIGPDYEGIDYLLDQWRLYDAFFPYTQFMFKAFEVATAGDATTVILDVELAIHSRRDGVLALYPGLRNEEYVIQAMVSAALHIPVKMRFSFGADGVCTWFGTEFDYISGLQRALGSLEAVAKCLQNANISFATGQIRLEDQSRGYLPRGGRYMGEGCKYKVESDIYATESQHTSSWNYEV